MHFIFNRVARRHNRLLNSLAGECTRKKLLQTTSRLALLCGAHTGAMMAFEKLPLIDAAWLTLTTAATVGYGDLAAKTLAGRASTVLLMYAAGIALLAQAAGLFFEYRQEKRDRILNGKWRWNMEDHIVFLNSPAENPQGYFKNLLNEFRKSALPQAQKPALIVSGDLKENLSDDLRKLGVAHVNHTATEKIAFANSSLDKASVIVILCQNENNSLSDSVTFDLVMRAREANPNATVIAEAVSDENRKRLLNAGANHVIRPIRSYPELVVRTILAPGTEFVIEEIFNAAGEECVRYDVPLKGKWADVAVNCIKADIGTPLAYVDMSGRVISNANPNKEIEGKAIIALVREGNLKNQDEILATLAPVSSVRGNAATFRPA